MDIRMFYIETVCKKSSTEHATTRTTCANFSKVMKNILKSCQHARFSPALLETVFHRR